MNISEVKEGDVIVADRSFTCIRNKAVLTVKKMDFKANGTGGLYVPCLAGKHFLDGQVGDGGTLIGFSKG